MKIALFQTKLAWENPEKNRKFIEEYVVNETQAFDLLVLPEMFTSGFTMNPQNVAETLSGQTVQWLQSLAKTKNCAITGSLVIEENGKYFNRMVFVFPTGEMEYYDKRHLFTLAGENQKYQAGKQKKIVQYLDYKFCLQVCYDLRFPVFSRNNGDYDLLIYLANWPIKRIDAWDTLLKARSIENQCFTIGVNRVGEDGNGIPFNGYTKVFDAFGKELFSAKENMEEVLQIEINLDDLKLKRRQMNFLKDRDNFTLE
mgnify:CR=1 FL=1